MNEVPFGTKLDCLVFLVDNLSGVISSSWLSYIIGSIINFSSRCSTYPGNVARSITACPIRCSIDNYVVRSRYSPPQFFDRRYFWFLLFKYFWISLFASGEREQELARDLEFFSRDAARFITCFARRDISLRRRIVVTAVDDRPRK